MMRALFLRDLRLQLSGSGGGMAGVVFFLAVVATILVFGIRACLAARRVDRPTVSEIPPLGEKTVAA